VASITSWVDTRTLAILTDPLAAADIYAKLEAEPPEELDEEEELWPAALERAGEQATWVLRSLLNAKVHPAEQWMEDYRLHGRTVVLRQGPIEDVVKVEMYDPCGQTATSELTDWCWAGDNAVTFGASSGFYSSMQLCSCRDDVVRIHFKTKDNLPPGALVNVTWLAGEHLKAATGQSCSLPERITSITRQGVSWTMLDPMQFLESGLTGVGRLDSWLSTARREHPSASMYDPVKSDRLRSELLALEVVPA